jgi:hypothetical protein
LVNREGFKLNDDKKNKIETKHTDYK